MDISTSGRGRRRWTPPGSVVSQVERAREILDLQQQARELRLSDPKAAFQAISKAELLRNGIEALGSGDKNRMEPFQKDMNQLAGDMRQLLTQAQRDGLKIRPSMGI